MSVAWRKDGNKFYTGKIGESPWNNDQHHRHTLQNENHYYAGLGSKTLKFERDRNPFNLTLDEVVNDETAAKKFAVRCTNGIRPRCSDRSEPDTSRRLDQTVSLMRNTNSMLASAIPDLRAQVASTNERISRIERRRTLSRGGTGRAQSAMGSQREATGGRATYDPVQQQSWRSQRRAKTAGSVRSGMSSVLDGARDVLGKATNVLETRPQTAKTTKTILSHRNRLGWSNTLRAGDIVKHAGSNFPRRGGYDLEVDHSTGELRKRPVKIRPSSAAGYAQPSCRRVPGYKAPHEDYGPNAPGEGSEDPSFYVRPEDLDIVNPAHS